MSTKREEKELTLTIADFAYGGAAIGRDENGRPVFVQGAIPGERVRVALVQDKPRYAHAYLLEVEQASPQRVQPRCPHYGECGGCHYQHMTYETQLRAKTDVVRDQLHRIGGIKNANVRPTLPSPATWSYAIETSFSPTAEGGLGYWSQKQQEVIAINTCPILAPQLLALYQDVELDLPGLRKLTLRAGAEGEMLAALEVDGVEPPELTADFPVSVAIILPDRNAASLIGDPYLTQEIKERTFRVSPGCFFHPNPAATELLIDVVLAYADLQGHERVLELYSGVGLLTAFLAEKAREVIGVEVNDDAAADLIANLNHLNNVTLFHGLAEEVLPAIEPGVDLLVVSPEKAGMAGPVIGNIKALAAKRLIYVSSEVATLARDGRGLAEAGYDLVEAQPVDMMPQTYQVDTVSLWAKS